MGHLLSLAEARGRRRARLAVAARGGEEKPNPGPPIDRPPEPIPEPLRDPATPEPAKSPPREKPREPMPEERVSRRIARPMAGSLTLLAVLDAAYSLT